LPSAAAAKDHAELDGLLRPMLANANLDPTSSGRRFSPLRNDVPSDLAKGPIEPVIAAGIDPELATPLELEKRERNRLKTFIKRALLDPRVLEFCALVPESLPSNRPVAKFEGCQ
jgi:hypothetical protein